MKRRMVIRGAAALAAAGMLPATRAESEWPQRPVRLIVPYAPGGTTDAASRLAADGASRTLGQQILVENRPGGAGSLGIELTISSAPDGYTFVCIADSGAYQPLLRPALKWSVQKDLTPVSLLVMQPVVIAVHPSLGVESLQDLMVNAKSGTMQYAVSLTGSTHHLAGELLAQRAHVKWTHIPYKGGGQAINDLVAGHVKVGILGSGPVIPHVKSGRLKLLAVTTSTRVPSLPDVPTVAESGYPGYEVPQWFGVFAPAGTSTAIVQRMQGALARALKQPKSVEVLQSMALEPVGSTSAELDERVRSESAIWAGAAKSLGLQGT